MGKHRKPAQHNAAKAIGIASFTGAAALTTGAQPALAAPNWDRLAQCESSGDWSINTGNGFFGGLQFSPTTWLEFGGGVYAQSAHLASREQQIEIASKVLAVQGPNAWPTCSQQKVPGWWEDGAAPAVAPPPAPAPAPAPPPPPPAPPAPVIVEAAARTSAWMWPVDCPLTSGYGMRGGGMHDGADFGCPIGTPIRAASSGTIMAGTGFNTDPGGYGNYIQQLADSGETIQYGHVSDIFVGVGDWVEVGQVIGAVGNAGSSTGPHLHLRISAGDPVAFLNSVGAMDTGAFDMPPAPPAPAIETVAVPVFDDVVASLDRTPIFDGLAAAYAVESGDTLGTIAGDFGTSVQAILDLNPWIGDPNLIFADRDVLRMI